MANILFLTQIVPFPPDAGPKVKTWHVLRFLAAQGHAITLVTFVRAEEKKHLPALEQLCESVHAIPLRRSRLADVAYLLRSQFSGRPFLVERDDRRAMRQQIDSLINGGRFDIVHADQMTMCEFARPFGNLRRIFDAHNATWAITERMRAGASPLMRAILSLETRRIRRYEAELVRTFEHTLAVTDIDKGMLLQAVEQVAGAAAAAAAADRIVTVPITIDTQTYVPLARRPGSTNIVTLGSLHYPPNADGVRWFMQSVYPRIRRQRPDATLTVIGKNPPADFNRLAETDPSITVTGNVPELEPYLAQAAVLVVPVRAGGGMRVRILEAFARQMPLVTTTIGLEGIGATHGVEVLVADEPGAFAAAVVELLDDEPRRERIARNGRRLAERTYDWQVALQPMLELYT